MQRLRYRQVLHVALMRITLLLIDFPDSPSYNVLMGTAMPNTDERRITWNLQKMQIK